MLKIHSNHTIQIHIKGSGTSDNLISEKKIYIYIYTCDEKRERQGKKGVIKRVIKGTLLYTTCATALL